MGHGGGGGYGTCVKSAVVALTSAPQLSAITSQIISISATLCIHLMCM